MGDVPRAVLGASSISGIPWPISIVVERVLDRAIRPMWLGVISLVELFAAAALIFVWAGPLLFRALDDEWWQQLAAILALAAVAVSVLVVLFLPRLLAAPARVEPRCTPTRAEGLRTRARRW